MTIRLGCGHPVGWMLRLQDGPKLKKYCWGCIIEKIGATEVGRPTPVVKANPYVDSEIVTTDNTKSKKVSKK